MRMKFKRIVAALVSVTMVATPVTAWADKPGQDYCSTYSQVQSNATGGDYVGGLLMYETTGSVRRDGQSTTTTTTESVGGSLGAPGSGGTATYTTTVATTQTGTSVTTSEPIGFYSMNDGSVYEVNCLTGSSQKVG